MKLEEIIKLNTVTRNMLNNTAIDVPVSKDYLKDVNECLTNLIEVVSGLGIIRKILKGELK